MSAADQQSPGSDPGPGGRLRAARAAMNVEVREVADALNLPTGTIEAIEANAFELLPNRVFARGYVRAYAKLVELEPDPIVASFQQASEPHADLAPVTGTTLPLASQSNVGEQLAALRSQAEAWARESPPRALGALAGLFLLLVLLLWLMFGGHSEPVAEEAVDVDAAPVTTPATPGSTPAVVAPVELPLDDDAQRGGFTDAPEAVPEAAPSLSTPADQDLNTGPDAVVRLGAGDDRLSMRFVADCWVEVRNAEDRVLYSDLGQSNKRLQLTGAGPFRILLGYAPGVELSFNGERVVLAPHTRNDVARLVLGQ